MPTKNPRVNVVLEKPLYDALREIAERDNVSLSTKIRDLVREALEANEDLALVQFAEERDATFDRRAAVTHEQAWSDKPR